MKSASKLWHIIAQTGLKPTPKTSVSEWADDYRMLSKGVSAEPGRWKTSRAPYQKEMMDAFTQQGVHKVVVKSASQVGKALAIDTPILTTQGWKPMLEVAPGDEVFGPDGKAHTVLWQSAVMTNHDCYRIMFSDNSNIVADADHKWYVETDKEKTVLTTDVISTTYKHGNRNTYAIPVAQPLETDEKNLPIHPYVLGAWLGDGNSYSAQITMHRDDVEIAKYIEECGSNVELVPTKGKEHVLIAKVDSYVNGDICRRGHDKTVTGVTSDGRCAECHRQISMRNKWKCKKDISVDPIVNTQNTLRSKLDSLNLIGNKHIPEMYLRASYEQRLQLLQGLMDTDGYISEKGIAEITQKSKLIIDGVYELLVTMGFKPVLKVKQAVCSNSPTKATSTVYRLTFTVYGDTPIFKLQRKLARMKSQEGCRVSETKRRRIIDVTKVDSVPVKCIAIDSDDHLYLAGKALIPTHNSDIMNNVIGRYAHLDPASIMMIQPTVDLAQDYSKSRISPMITDTPVLGKLFNTTSKDTSTAKTRDGSNTILSKLYPGGRLIMTGANSPAGLASRPIRVLLADEVDRFPDSAGNEGDPVDLAAKRMTTFWNKVMGLFSTPTNEGSSRIDVEYIAGTQEEWQHKCPNCGEYHLIRYTDIICDSTEHLDAKGRKTVVVNDVKWRCPDCGMEYTEMEMRRAKQKYIVKNPAAIQNGTRSFFVNGFTSPWLTWPTIMKEWLEAKGDPSREKVVMNTRFGESYAQTGAFEGETVFLKRRESYGAELPDGVLLLTAAVDTQDNRLEYEICGWGKDEEAWGIQKGIILGKPDNPATWKALDEILDKDYTFADKTGLRVARTFIDSGGHYTSNVYADCQRNFAKQRFAIKGYSGTPGIPLNYKIGKASNTSIPLVMLGVDDGKQQVINRLSIETMGSRYFHFPIDEEDLLLTNRGYDELYFKGIISEHKVQKKKNGVIREVWEPTAGIRNEPLDLRVYNLACMKSIKPDWERLEEVLTGNFVAPERKTRVKKTKNSTRRASKSVM